MSESHGLIQGMNTNCANTAVEKSAGKAATSCSPTFFQLLNHKFKLQEQLNLSGNVSSLNILLSNHMLLEFVVHGVCFIPVLSTAVLTRCTGDAGFLCDEDAVVGYMIKGTLYISPFGAYQNLC
jgi:hypothetical protein